MNFTVISGSPGNGDLVAIAFNGATSAAPGTNPGDIDLMWTQATAGTPTIDYDVYVSTVSQGEDLASPFNGGTLISAVSGTTISNLNSGQRYFIIVRGRSALSCNQDENFIEKSAIAK